MRFTQFLAGLVGRPGALVPINTQDRVHVAWADVRARCNEVHLEYRVGGDTAMGITFSVTETGAATPGILNVHVDQFPEAVVQTRADSLAAMMEALQVTIHLSGSDLDRYLSLHEPTPVAREVIVLDDDEADVFEDPDVGVTIFADKGRVLGWKFVAVEATRDPRVFRLIPERRRSAPVDLWAVDARTLAAVGLLDGRVPLEGFQPVRKTKARDEDLLVDLTGGDDRDHEPNKRVRAHVDPHPHLDPSADADADAETETDTDTDTDTRAGRIAYPDPDPETETDTDADEEEKAIWQAHAGLETETETDDSGDEVAARYRARRGMRTSGLNGGGGGSGVGGVGVGSGSGVGGVGVGGGSGVGIGVGGGGGSGVGPGAVAVDPAIAAAARSLRDNGYAVIDVMDKKTRAQVLEAFKVSLLTFPEYRRSAADPTRTPEGTPIIYVAGGFGALGNPASFHSEFTRWKREAGLAALMPLFREYIRLAQPPEWDADRKKPYDPTARRVCAGMDRDMIRPAGTSVTEESFHRDDSPQDRLRDGDEVFGCLTNISEEVFRFGCVPGSHVTLAPWKATGGFQLVPEGDVPGYKARKVEVPYGPGQTILFFQHLVHFIWKAPTKHATNYRLTQAFWLTDYPTPPFDYADAIVSQGVPVLKSGQKVPLYAANHGSCFLNKDFTLVTGYRDSLIGWSAKTFVPCMLEEKVHGTTGQRYRVVRRFSKSLAELRLPMYPHYAPEETAIFTPGTSFALRTFASEDPRTRQQVRM